MWYLYQNELSSNILYTCLISCLLPVEGGAHAVQGIDDRVFGTRPVFIDVFMEISKCAQVFLIDGRI